MALLEGTPDSLITTFDILAPSEIPGSLLARPHPRVACAVADLSDPRCFAEHVDVLAGADLVFVDGPKDVQFEEAFLPAYIAAMKGNEVPLTILDDIRVPNMLNIWRDLPLPKLDVTSFGHWSGTGVFKGHPVD